MDGGVAATLSYQYRRQRDTVEDAGAVDVQAPHGSRYIVDHRRRRPAAGRGGALAANGAAIAGAGSRLSTRGVTTNQHGVPGQQAVSGSGLSLRYQYGGTAHIAEHQGFKSRATSDSLPLSSAERGGHAAQPERPRRPWHYRNSSHTDNVAPYLSCGDPPLPSRPPGQSSPPWGPSYNQQPYPQEAWPPTRMEPPVGTQSVVADPFSSSHQGAFPAQGSQRASSPEGHHAFCCGCRCSSNPPHWIAEGQPRRLSHSEMASSVGGQPGPSSSGSEHPTVHRRGITPNMAPARHQPSPPQYDSYGQADCSISSQRGDNSTLHSRTTWQAPCGGPPRIPPPPPPPTGGEFTTQPYPQPGNFVPPYQSYKETATHPPPSSHQRQGFPPPPPVPPPPPSGVPPPPPPAGDYRLAQWNGPLVGSGEPAAKRLRTNDDLYCRVCSLSFSSRQRLQVHLDEDHIPCDVPACQYSAPLPILEAHKLRHMTTRDGVSIFDDPNEISLWIRARKKCFPTKEIIARKEKYGRLAVSDQEASDGEVVEKSAIEKLLRKSHFDNSSRKPITSAFVPSSIIRRQRALKIEVRKTDTTQSAGRKRYGRFGNCEFTNAELRRPFPICDHFLKFRTCKWDSCHYSHDVGAYQRWKIQRNLRGFDIPLRPTVLYQLLRPEIQEAESLILQAFRYLVEQNFFRSVRDPEEGPPSVKSSLAKSKVAALVEEPVLVGLHESSDNEDDADDVDSLTSSSDDSGVEIEEPPHQSAAGSSAARKGAETWTPTHGSPGPPFMSANAAGRSRSVNYRLRPPGRRSAKDERSVLTTTYLSY